MNLRYSQLPWVNAAALVLLFGAGAKWHELPIINRTGQGLFQAPWFVFTQIQLEAALAFWLLSGLLPLWSRRAAIAAFTLFALFTAYKALTGADSCGCFGQLKVNPYLTLALDTAILTALLLTRKRNAFTTESHGVSRSQPNQLTTSSSLSVTPCDSVRLRGASPHWRLAFLIAGMAIALSLTLWRMPTLAASPSHPGITFASGLAILG